MKKILIVDDQKYLRELVEVTLRYGDFEIYSATSGEEAVQLAKSHKPELIIMDVMMPGKLDGLAATKVIKSDPETKKSYVLMLTSKGRQSDIDLGKAAGADDYFIKPFSPLELMKKVEEVLSL